MSQSPLTPYETEILAQARSLVAGDPPKPWRRSVIVDAAGVQVGGWTKDDQVLVISVDGYSVTAADTGRRLVRDRDQATTFAALSPDRMLFRVPTTGEAVSVFGVYGGNGIHQTQDGWGVEVIYPWWPRAAVIMRTPFVRGSGLHNYLDRAHVIELHRLDGWLRCGFSPSGRPLLILGSAGAELFSR